MDNNELLPIGSVVILKKGHHRSMIVGYSPIDTEKSKKVYDYYGVLYPEGFFDPKQVYVFNHSDIKTIYSKGYSDEEEVKYRVKIRKILSDIKDENGTLKLSDAELVKYVYKTLKGGN